MKAQTTFLTLVLLLLCACGGAGGGSGDSAQSGKAVFSQWADGSKTINLSGGQFNTPFLIQWLLADGEICQSNMTINGDNSSGSYIISNSSQDGGTSGSSCSSLNGNGTYVNSGSMLSVCVGGTCSFWN